MIQVLFSILVLFSLPAQAVCTAYCNTGKPCGDGCISIHKTCRKSWTTACKGERPKTAKKGYDNPKKIEPGEQSKDGE